MAGWHRQLNRTQWRIFIGSLLGRLLDGYETYALILIVVPALRQLLDPAQLSSLPQYAGAVMSITLLGRVTGGMLTGIAADYFGRRRVLVVTILFYAAFTGLTGFAQSWVQLALCRFLTGTSLGGDLAASATLISESWPSQARAKGQSLMQSAFAWGSLAAAAAWYGLDRVAGEGTWRPLFFVGVLPALLVLNIRRGYSESEGWQQKHAERRHLQTQRRAGLTLSSDQSVVANFSLASLFGHRELRRLMLLCTLMSIATTTGYWAVSSWIPAYVESVARAAHMPNPIRWASLAGVLYTVGAIAGYLAAAFLADVLGRRCLLACFFIGSLFSTAVLYLWTHSLPAVIAAAALNGAFTLGQFAWIAIYPPELFPTAVRATAISTIFNIGRLIAFLAPLLSGYLITRLGSYNSAAMLFALVYLAALCALPFLPETKGKPLPA